MMLLCSMIKKAQKKNQKKYEYTKGMKGTMMMVKL